MKSLITFSVLLLFTLSSNNLDIRFFTMQTPNNWTYVKKQGIDSFVGDIQLDDGQKVSFDLGNYSNSLDKDTLTHSFKYEIIDNQKAKIIIPKKNGKGTTGVYFENLSKPLMFKGSKLQISGYDLNEKNQLDFLKSIRSIKFKEK